MRWGEGGRGGGGREGGEVGGGREGRWGGRDVRWGEGGEGDRGESGQGKVRTGLDVTDELLWQKEHNSYVQIEIYE